MVRSHTDAPVDALRLSDRDSSSESKNEGISPVLMQDLVPKDKNFAGYFLPCSEGSIAFRELARCKKNRAPSATMTSTTIIKVSSPNDIHDSCVTLFPLTLKTA